MTLMYIFWLRFEMDQSFQDFFEVVERQTGERVKNLLSVNRGKYGSQKAVDYFRQQGIAFEKTEL